MNFSKIPNPFTTSFATYGNTGRLCLSFNIYKHNPLGSKKRNDIIWQRISVRRENDTQGRRQVQEKGHSFGRGQGAIWRFFSRFPGGSAVKNLPANAGNMGSIPGWRRSHWRREWLPIPVYLPEEFHRQTEESGGLLSTRTQSQTWLSTHAGGSLFQMAFTCIYTFKYSCFLAHQISHTVVLIINSEINYD